MADLVRGISGRVVSSRCTDFKTKGLSPAGAISYVAFIACAAALFLIMSLQNASAAESLHAYIGTYTGVESRGIYSVRMDPVSGKLDQPELAAEVKSPSFLAFSPDRKCLYACNESGAGSQFAKGAVTAFALETTGALRELNRASSGGGGPCFVAVDKLGKNVLTANYGSGGVTVVPVNADGTLREPSCSVQHAGKGADPKRQAGPHAHSINVDPEGKFALAADLGIDQLIVYKFDAEKGELTSHSVFRTSPGAGPRHIAFHPNGRFVYLCNEMGNTVTALKYDGARGELEELETAGTLPGDFKGGNTTAEVQVHPSGKFVYVSNRGHDSIALFGVDQESGKLTLMGHTPSGGKTPRGFTIAPDGRFLVVANVNSNNVLSFLINPESGKLTATGSEVKVGKPVCVKFR